jgi:hypothetical protein
LVEVLGKVVDLEAELGKVVEWVVELAKVGD